MREEYIPKFGAFANHPFQVSSLGFSRTGVVELEGRKEDIQGINEVTELRLHGFWGRESSSLIRLLVDHVCSESAPQYEILGNCSERTNVS